ncbi:hypothetical protein ACH495_13285 [Micromonospora sp. NPDC018662]|uniref:hypothetical protein n=1 Tax=Micromonospora sp. NPDC018662 TaxID=3364238 RepID=UPI0037ACF8D6
MSTTASQILVRRAALLGGVVLAAVVALAAPASADPGGSHGRGPAVTLPAAPAAARVIRAQAAAPTISPAARQIRHVAAGKPATCATGNLCTFVWDPTTSNWEIFDLYACARYTVSNWLGAGLYVNAQTGSPTVTFYGQSGNVLNSFTATGTGSQNWDKVYSVRNCT